MPAPYEFTSFASQAAARPPSFSQKSPPTTPWVPGGKGTSVHYNTKGLPTKHEFEVRLQKESGAAVDRALLHAQCAGVEGAMERLEGSIDDFIGEVEEHFVTASASHALIANRLARLSTARGVE